MKKGFKHSQEAKLKMRNYHLGKPSGMLNKHHSEETKDKIKKSNIGKKRSLEARKKMSEARLGTHPSEETRIKMGKARMGERNNSWKGGVTDNNIKIRHSIEFNLWREAVFARDNWTCQKCYIKGGILNAHHIKNFAQYPELRFAINNGITFCKICHILFHKQFKKKNNTKEQIENFLKVPINNF